MRPPHLLTSNKGLEFPEDFIFFDTETLPFKISTDEVEHKFRLGTALYWRNRNDKQKDTLEWLKFSNPEEFWDFVEKKNLPKRRLVLFAHNLSYDIKVLKGFETLKGRGYHLLKLISQNTINIWKFKKQNRSILFLDSMNFFKLPLARLGKDVGLEKMKMPAFKEPDKVWFKYCQRDVEILYKAVKLWLKFVKENNLGCFAVTLPSQSFNAFRHRFNKTNIYIHSNKKAIALERESYHGGRVECFFLGKLPEKKYYYLDVNSMYPTVMKENKYPVKIRAYLKSLTLEGLKNHLSNFCVIARVKLEIPENAFPYKVANELCFPTGRFQTVLTSRDLEYALSKRFVKQVFETAVYDSSPLFIDYVNFFYKKRIESLEDSNLSFAFISKLFLNSLYGKWGQRNEVFKTIAENTNYPDGCFEEWDLDTYEIIKYRVINGKLERSVGKVESFHSFPAIASHITADARFLLYRYIKTAGKKNVFYCDTDSLFVNRKGLDNLKPYLSNNIMGKLKVKASAKNLEIRGLKDYTFGKRTRIKGIKKSAVKIAENKYVQWHWEGIRGSLRKSRLNKMVLRKVTKVLSRNYFKGNLKESGKVVPFILNEL